MADSRAGMSNQRDARVAPLIQPSSKTAPQVASQSNHTGGGGGWEGREGERGERRGEECKRNSG